MKRVLVGSVLALAITLATMTPAAAEPTAGGPAARAASTTAAETRVAAAVEPTMFPPAERVRWSAGGVRDQRCETGTLCLDVWDPTRNTYKVFILRKCATRALHDFHNTGTPEFINHQTPHTVTRFLGRGGRVLVESTAPSHTTRIDWGPIWYIDVC